MAHWKPRYALHRLQEAQRRALENPTFTNLHRAAKALSDLNAGYFDGPDQSELMRWADDGGPAND